jgi:hypothetical protein
MRLFDDAKSWLGAEPFLGIITLAIVLPLAGMLGYLVLESVLSASTAALVFLGAAASVVLAARLAERVSGELRRRVLRIYCYAVWLAFVGWTLWDRLVPWPGFNAKTAADLMFGAFWLYLIILAFRRPDEAEALPDYRQK